MCYQLLDSGDEDFRVGEAGAGSELEDSSAECIALSLLSQLGSHRLPPADRLRSGKLMSIYLLVLQTIIGEVVQMYNHGEGLYYWVNARLV